MSGQKSIWNVYVESKRFEKEMSQPPLWFSLFVISVMAVGFWTIFYGAFNLVRWMVR